MTSDEQVTSDEGGGVPVVNIVGERVALGPLTRDLVPALARWHNDFHVQRTYGDLPRPLTIEAETARYERKAVATDAYWFAIRERATGRAIGQTDLFDIDWRGRTATFGILIGEADCRGRGYGTEAARLMLDYAFTALGLHSVMLMTDEFNLAGQRAYRKAGFKEFGRRRQCSFLAGRLWDLIYMDCLATEFTSPVLGRVFVPDEARRGPGG
ncbi:MAG TPA: GNAT family protein [Thermomicrobiales bacterium]|nr:GNAT family protein [Thermomicrobiales bacterium]